MPAIYQTECWCDSCGQSIKDRITNELLTQRDKLLKELALCIDSTTIQAEVAQIDDRLDWFEDERNYDSDEFPKYQSKDEPSDSPSHCAGGEECLEHEVLSDGSKIGALLSTSLTTVGVEYIKGEIARGGEVTEFWREQFADYELDDLDIAERCSDFRWFFKWYCDALCFTATDDSEQGEPLFPCGGGEFSDSWYGEREVVRLLDRDELREIKTDCAGFFLDHRSKFNGAYDRAGMDFHFSRNGHGTGFFDRYDTYGDSSGVLHELAKMYGTCEMIGKCEDGEPVEAYLHH